MASERRDNFQTPIWAMLALLGIIVVAVFMRFNNLSVPSIWIDELNHFYAAQSLNESGRAIFPSGESNERALIYSKLVAFSFRLFGANEFSVRFPSALAGVFCIIAGFWIALRMFDPPTAVLTALFMAVSPFMIGWARMSRFYTLFQLLFMLGVYAFYLGYEDSGRGMFARWQQRALTSIKARALIRGLQQWRLNLFWLAIAAIVLLVAYQVHQLTALFVIGLAVYAALMFLREWRAIGLRKALASKYAVTAIGIVVTATLAVALIPSIRAFVDYAVNYAPKWSEGTRFQDKKLYIDFIFDHYNFPMGALFFIGMVQIFARFHQGGIYLLSFFLGTLFMFMFVFAYAHFQYMFHVYGFLIMSSAFAFANIIGREAPAFKANWFANSRFGNSVPKLLLPALFLVWLPLTPSLRLAKNIPFFEDGKFNGAMYVDEWREACRFVEKHIGAHDLVISTDALGTLHYLGRVDYDLNFPDFDLAQENDLRNDDGTHFDLYSGKPFIRDLTQLQQLASEHRTIWVLGQHYKLLEAEVFVPKEIREFVLENFERVYSTKNNTVVIFRATDRDDDSEIELHN